MYVAILCYPMLCTSVLDGTHNNPKCSNRKQENMHTLCSGRAGLHALPLQQEGQNIHPDLTAGSQTKPTGIIWDAALNITPNKGQ